MFGALYLIMWTTAGCTRPIFTNDVWHCCLENLENSSNKNAAPLAQFICMYMVVNLEITLGINR